MKVDPIERDLEAAGNGQFPFPAATRADLELFAIRWRLTRSITDDTILVAYTVGSWWRHRKYLVTAVQLKTNGSRLGAETGPLAGDEWSEFYHAWLAYVSQP